MNDLILRELIIFNLLIIIIVISSFLTRTWEHEHGITGQVYNREPFDKLNHEIQGRYNFSSAKSRDNDITRRENELPLERKQPIQVTRRGPSIRECIFQFNVKCELLDFYVNVNEFWELFVTREKSQYFYVNAFCKVV